MNIVTGTIKAMGSGMYQRIREDMKDPCRRNMYIGCAIGTAVSVACGPLAMVVFPVTGSVIGGVLTKNNK